MAFEFKLPDIGEGVVEGEIVRWFIKEGDGVEEDQPLVEVMTDKATVELPSPVQGRVVKRGGEEGDIVQVGATLVVIETEAQQGETVVKEEQVAEVPQVQAAGKGKEQPTSVSGRALATPAIRKLAQERSIDLSQIHGSGPGGRIRKEDLERVGAPAAAGEVETIAYRGLRRKIGDHVSASKRTAAHYTYVEEADVTQLVRRREELIASSSIDDVRITYLPFFMKAVVEGLKKHPLVNSTLDEAKGVIELRKYYNIGIAVATPEGLVVPVVKGVEEKSLSQVAREVAKLTSAARKGTLELEDLKGGSFTITSLGVLGGVLATPIINYPEVAILGVHKISQRPVVQEGEIVIRDMVYLSLSLDHRVLDGVAAAEFLRDVIAQLESPSPLFEAL